MGMKLGVVGHTHRLPQIEELSAAVNPDAVLIDDGVLGVAGNHAQTLACLSRRADPDDWLVVLEDDAVPAQPFRETVAELLALAPTRIVSFYLGTGYPAQYQRRIADAVAADTSWIVAERLLHAVGYAIAPAFAPSIVGAMTENARRPSRGRWAPDDLISEWVIAHGEYVAYSNPSIVQHRDEESVIATRMHLGQPTYGRKRPRQAHRFGSRLTWDDSSVTL